MERMPKWIREVNCFTDIMSCIVFEGNIYDEYPVYDEGGSCEDFRSLDTYIYYHFHKKGYKVCFYDLVNGFYNRQKQEEVLDIFEMLIESMKGDRDNSLVQQYEDYRQNLENTRTDGQISNNLAMGFLESSEIIKSILIENTLPSVFCINFASRILTDPSRMIEVERGIFSNLMYSTINARRNYCEDGRTRQNMLVLITDKINDIPAWFYLDNPYVKTIMIPKPDKHIRKQYAQYEEEFFFEEEGDQAGFDEASLDRFVEMTAGMKVLDMRGIRELKRVQKVTFDKISDVIALYKYGIKENPWDDIERDKLNAETIKKRVKGQDLAVEKALAVVKRAKSGMSGLQHSSSSKPKGILFFAGPTGTGKTELAKALAEMLFGDESACRRFDMSEYAESHAAQKLFGAPPGYIGYEAGGQLTNTVKEHPFSLLLFDEIEKASPSIWDKFLQILEDGRMTDGQGNTVYFSETIIVFTSNLGIYEDENGVKKRVVNINMPYDQVSEKITNGIRNYFNDKGKPEVLNRIGRNLVVFNFIQPDAARQIMDSQLTKICDMLKENKKITVDFKAEVKEKLFQKVLGNLEEGGRGVGNVVEEYFITPLSTYIFDQNVQEGQRIVIRDIEGMDVSDDSAIIPKIIAE